MSAPSYTLKARAPDGSVPRELTTWSELSYTVRFNAVGEWSVEVPADTAAADVLRQPRAGLLIQRDEVTVMSGPVTARTVQWGGDQGDDGDQDNDEGGQGGPPRGTLTVAGADDLEILTRRLAYPSEGPPFTAAHDTRTGVAETVLRAYVNHNAGPLAPTDRQIPGLGFDSDQGRGTTITGNARFNPLLELLAELAGAGGVGFRVVQAPAGSGLEFQVYTPTDQSARAVFSRERGNLASYEYKVQTPTATHVLVAGGGEGIARVVVQDHDAAALSTYGRIEGFIDRRDTSDTDDMEQAAAEALAEQATKVTLAAVPLDAGPVRWLRDYHLGDRVTVVVDGEALTDLVREVNVSVDDDGERVQPVIGSPGATLTPKLFTAVERLAARTRQLERRY